MNNKIVIGKPYISRVEGDGIINSPECVRLCAEIDYCNPNTMKQEKKTMFFEVEKDYAGALVEERSDAFVMGLLTTAMENGMDIVFTEPMSEKLYFQITNQYIPIVAENNPNWVRAIHLNGPVTSERIENKGGVATGCSGGVDSFYTIERHLVREKLETYKLTHILFSSVGTLDDRNERIIEYFNHTLNHMHTIASELGIKAIGVYSNIHEFYKFPYKGFSMFYATTYGACAYALQKLLSVYYISAGYPISEFTLKMDSVKEYDASVFDVFTIGCMDTESLSFYVTGIEATRAQRINYIANNPVAQKHLTTCGIEQSGIKIKGKYINCGHCRKCLPALVHLYAGNNLEKFEKIIDIEEFKQHKTKSIARMMAMTNTAYRKQAILTAKENNVTIPFGSYVLYYVCYKPLYWLLDTFRESKIARKIYYALDLDIKIHGFRSAKYDGFKK